MPVPPRLVGLFERFTRLARARWRTALVIGGPLVLVLFALVQGGDGPNIPHYELPEGATVPPPTTAPVTPAPPGPLPAVAGTTTIPPVPTVGSAVLRGTVFGPQGPVPGATVRIDRFDRDRRTTTDMVTQPDGTWALAGIPGGRYRVRAFQSPTLAQIEPEIFFLTAAEDKVLNLDVNDFGGPQLQVAVAPDPPQLDQLLTLTVQLESRSVSGDGVVRADPLVGWTVNVVSAGTWTVRQPAVSATDGAGRASFLLECDAAGPNRVQVAVRQFATDQATVLGADGPDCEAPPPLTTASTVPPSSPSTPPNSTPPSPN
ncbi:MAG: carboxypeptidase-like regulatory domain-containing protein [Acidimicrobiales bacterium]